MMKLLNKRQKSNGGFSLVELIVVIAIMVVLVAVLAPVFTKYIESSRRSTDVQNANSISEAVLADVADGKKADEVNAANYVPSGVAGGALPEVKGDAVENPSFKIEYNATNNTCAVKVGSWDLTTEEGAKDYKDAPSV